MDLQKRKVRIHSLTITSVDLPDVTMKVTCSRGTYVRSLAADLGKELGPGAHLKSLMRLCSGPFSVKDALSLESLAQLSRDRLFQERVIPLKEALPDMKETEVDNRMAQKIRNGQQPGWDEVGVTTGSSRLSEGYLKLVAGKDLVAIAKAHHPLENKGSLKIMRVFN